MDTGSVGRLHCAGCNCRLLFQEVPYCLRRSPIASGQTVGCLFDLPLPVHTAQNALYGHILRTNGNQQGCIGVFSAPIRIAHAIGDHAALFRGRSHNIAAGAHTEGIDGGILQMAHQLIICRWQPQVACTVLRNVDHFLGMLNTHAHGKGLSLHGNPLLMEHFKGIPGAVPHRQNHMVTGNFLVFFSYNGGNCAIFRAKVGDAGIEADLSAQAKNLPAQILHHGQQHICAHMGLGIKENILICTEGHKLLQNPADPGIIQSGIQLSIGESTGAALAKLDIAAGIQLTGLKEMLHLFMSGLSILSPFQNQRPQASLGENQGRKHTGRAKAHHHRAVLGPKVGFRHLIIGNGRNSRPFAAGEFQNLIFIAVHCHINGVDYLDIRLFTGVDGTADNLDLSDFGICNL